MKGPLTAAAGGTLPARWLPCHVKDIVLLPEQIAPLITARDFARGPGELDLWDAWPLQRMDGHKVEFENGSSLWMALGAPRFEDPDERHAHARIYLFERNGHSWRPIGPALPEDFSPGSREWSGSAVLWPDGGRVTLYFTAAGNRNEAAPSFRQRLFMAEARLKRPSGGLRLEHWHGLREIVRRDPVHYMATSLSAGAPGIIKAFRDPAFFCDPADGKHYLFFTGSQAGSPSAYNGVVGWAIEQAAGDWRLLPPLISANGLNNELERPHALVHEGAYYLFWSTQRHVFDPAGPAGPTGLYGMVSDRLDGGWQPLNGTGLVLANPPDAPAQAYSWLVLPDLSVTSFVDDWGPLGTGRPRRFGGALAPELRLALDGPVARLAG